MLSFRFDFEKTLQASAVALRLSGGNMGMMRLLKILYITDRELLLDGGATLTGDRAIAMKHGPVLSDLYNIVKERSSRSPDWDRHIQRDGYMLSLRDDPGRGRLSPEEVDKLEEVCDRYREMDDFELSEVTHHYAEWISAFAKAASTPIHWDAVLEGEGMKDLIPEIERDEAESALVDSVLGV